MREIFTCRRNRRSLLSARICCIKFCLILLYLFKLSFLPLFCHSLMLLTGRRRVGAYRTYRSLADLGISFGIGRKRWDFQISEFGVQIDCTLLYCFKKIFLNLSSKMPNFVPPSLKSPFCTISLCNRSRRYLLVPRETTTVHQVSELLGFPTQMGIILPDNVWKDQWKKLQQSFCKTNSTIRSRDCFFVWPEDEKLNVGEIW